MGGGQKRIKLQIKIVSLWNLQNFCLLQPVLLRGKSQLNIWGEARESQHKTRNREINWSENLKKNHQWQGFRSLRVRRYATNASQYKANAEIEKSVGKDLKQLYKEGNAIIKARRKRKQGNNGGDKQNSNNDEKEDNDNDVQISYSDDDNDNEGQSSESGGEEEENDDNNNDVHNSTREEEKKEDEDQGRTIFEV